ncbi:hypothetical protein [Metabacillus sp. Hm71]|uniref:hypothetical protein n=1 Tax=Metabacillus sp. Hm71 TaxID=3450743 RepID=UPI003F42D283
MNDREDYLQDYISRKVSQQVNEYGDEIELETIRYYDHCRAVATICQEKPPYKDYFAEAKDQTVRGAARKALKELYLQAYSS